MGVRVKIDLITYLDSVDWCEEKFGDLKCTEINTDSFMCRFKNDRWSAYINNDEGEYEFEFTNANDHMEFALKWL